MYIFEQLQIDQSMKTTGCETSEYYIWYSHELLFLTRFVKIHRDSHFLDISMPSIPRIFWSRARRVIPHIYKPSTMPSHMQRFHSPTPPLTQTISQPPRLPHKPPFHAQIPNHIHSPKSQRPHSHNRPTPHGLQPMQFIHRAQHPLIPPPNLSLIPIQTAHLIPDIGTMADRILNRLR